MTDDAAETPALKPCPFCRGEAHWSPTYIDSDMPGTVQCANGCGATVITAGTKAQRIAAWNTRPEMLSEAGERDAVRDILTALVTPEGDDEWKAVENAVDAIRRLAPAEPASGAGEPVVVEEAMPSPVDDAETRAFIAGWNATRSGTDFDMALHYWMLSSVKPSRSAATAKPTSEMLDAAEREGWDRAAAEQVWISMRLANGSAIPAAEVAG